MNHFEITPTQKKHTSTIFNLLFVFFLFASSAMSSQEETALQKVGELSFKTEVIDYGTINENANGERVFTFTNTGEVPIVITDVKTSCGCTVPTYDKTPVAPGKTGEIHVKYATNRIGAFTKTITVLSNAKENRKLLKIKGTVVKHSS